MKKHLILPLIVLSSFLVLSTNHYAFWPAEAAFDTKNVVNEAFDGNLDNWDLIGDASLEEQYSSMRLNPQNYSWNTSLGLNKKLNGDFVIKMEMTTTNIGGWFAVSFGSPFASSPFPNAQGGIVFFDDRSELLERVGGELKATEDFERTVFDGSINKKREAVFTIHEINSEHSSMQVTIYENDMLIGNVFSEPYEFNSFNGYMTFNTSSKDVEIFKIEVLDGDNKRLYYDDFSSCKVLYPTSGSIDSEWYSNDFSVEELKVGYIKYLSLNKPNDGIRYYAPLNQNENNELDIIYHLESELQYSSMDIGGESGFEIGKKDKDSHGYFFGIRRLAIGYSLIIYQFGSSEEYIVSTYNETSTMRISLQLDIHNNGDVDFIAGELSHTFNVSSYSGYFGLFHYDYLNNHPNSKGACIYSFRMNRTNYYDRTGSDIYMNFDGTKRTYFEDIDEYAYDYFISRREWNIGTHVSLSKWKTSDHGNGKLEFNSSTPTSMFGPKVIFKDFVVKFDVEITSEDVPYGGVVGLQFGNSRSGLLYENAKSLGIAYYLDEYHEYMTVAQATHMDFVDESTRYCKDELGHKDIFKEHPKFTMMFICRDNVVSMHYLLDGEDESTLAKERTSVICKENESTDGYISIYGANGISFAIDNLSIINLDYYAGSTTYTGQSNYQEVTRADFSKETSNAGLSFEKAVINGNKLNISENGFIKTNKLTNNGILRLSIVDIEDTLVIKQGALNIELINRNNKSIAISDTVDSQTFPLNSDFDFRQSLIEIEKLATHLTIRLKDKNTPLSSINNHVIKFETNATVSNNIVIESKGGFASLNALTFINLNRYATIYNRDYDEETDSFVPWAPKPTIDEKGGANRPVLIIILVSVGSAILLATGIILTILLIKRRKAHA